MHNPNDDLARYSIPKNVFNLKSLIIMLLTYFCLLDGQWFRKFIFCFKVQNIFCILSPRINFYELLELEQEILNWIKFIGMWARQVNKGDRFMINQVSGQANHEKLFRKIRSWRKKIWKLSLCHSLHICIKKQFEIL